MVTRTVERRVGRRVLKLSNLDKVLYPSGFTKADVLDYYAAVAPVMVPHLKDRAVTLKRYPDGTAGSFFYEKQCPRHRPEWVRTVPVVRKRDNKTIHYCLGWDRPTLVWMANLASLELHVSLAKASDIQRPTALVFDLDPGPPADIVQCCTVGLWLRDFFEGFGLDAFAKTSGSKGLQVYVPLNTAVTYGDTGPFAHAVAMRLEDHHPKLIVTTQKKTERKNKVLVDWSQNAEHKTTVAVYSLRARDRPTVSTPVGWDEVERCRTKKDAGVLTFEADEVRRRVDENGDLFEPVRKLKQRLPRL